jgi:hypothetical protein
MLCLCEVQTQQPGIWALHNIPSSLIRGENLLTLDDEALRVHGQPKRWKGCTHLCLCADSQRLTKAVEQPHS